MALRVKVHVFCPLAFYLFISLVLLNGSDALSDIDIIKAIQYTAGTAKIEADSFFTEAKKISKASDKPAGLDPTPVTRAATEAQAAAKAVAKEVTKLGPDFRVKDYTAKVDKAKKKAMDGVDAAKALAAKSKIKAVSKTLESAQAASVAAKTTQTFFALMKVYRAGTQLTVTKDVLEAVQSAMATANEAAIQFDTDASLVTKDDAGASDKFRPDLTITARKVKSAANAANQGLSSIDVDYDFSQLVGKTSALQAAGNKGEAYVSRFMTYGDTVMTVKESARVAAYRAYTANVLVQLVVKLKSNKPAGGGNTQSPVGGNSSGGVVGNSSNGVVGNHLLSILLVTISSLIVSKSSL